MVFHSSYYIGKCEVGRYTCFPSPHSLWGIVSQKAANTVITATPSTNICVNVGTVGMD